MKGSSGFMPEELLEEGGSSGHKLGQLVGDWFQDAFVMPLLDEIAGKLGLYLDHRLRRRSARAGKIIWKEEGGNGVDYDFVMELGGSESHIGVPVAFLECFWRRGARHSKDKARDDSGKLLPMRDTYPTARFLGIIAAGEFTSPASDLVRSRNIDLFYIPKKKIIDCFQQLDMQMDYPDSASEGYKADIARDFSRMLTSEAKSGAVAHLRSFMTDTVLNGYADRVKASLTALPQEIRIIGERRSIPKVFETVESAQEFLHSGAMKFDLNQTSDRFIYEITYSDGFEFHRDSLPLNLLRKLHGDITALDEHMRSL